MTFTLVICFLYVGGTVFGQELLTASDFFQRVSQRYEKLSDYTADFRWEEEDAVSEGVLYYKSPNLIRLDFTTPDEQVVVSDGEQLKVYVPQNNVVLRQQFDSSEVATLPGITGGEGLQLLRENYSIAYISEPRPLPTEGGTTPYYALRFTPKTRSEGFRSLDMYIDESLFIQRFIALTVQSRRITMVWTNVQENQNLTSAMFDYDAPGSANVYENFLY